MAHRWGSAQLLAIPVLALSLFLVGCPKRPATTAASAPAPTGTPAPSSPAPSSPSTPSMTPAPAAPATAAPATPPRPSEFAENANLKDVYFDFDKYDIRPGDARTLEGNARWLRANRDLILIEGHCDARGTNEYNVALGERRAKSTMDYLVAQGVAASRITIVSYGEERPQCVENNEACWSKNRRARFLVKSQ